MIAKALRSSLLPGLLTAFAATAAPAAADQSAGGASYVVTSVIDSAEGRQLSEEMLSFATSNGRTLVMLQDRAGSALVQPVTLDRNGLVPVATTDPAIACYDQAKAVLADAAAQSPTSPLSVMFAGAAVTVPLQLASAALADGTQRITARGTTQGTLTDGRAGTQLTFVANGTVMAKRGLLVGARFDELSLVTATGAPVSRISCAIERVTQRTPPTTSRVI